jgi:hypothetical protein
LRDKLQARIGERKHINIEVNRNKDEEKYIKTIITNNYITEKHQDYEQF